MTAAATTAPKSEPRPTSSAPAIKRKPRARSSPSRMPWHFQRGALRVMRRPMGLSANRVQPESGLGAFLETRCFALQPAQIVQFRAADFARANEVNMVDNCGVYGENALD